MDSAELIFKRSTRLDDLAVGKNPDDLARTSAAWYATEMFTKSSMMKEGFRLARETKYDEFFMVKFGKFRFIYAGSEDSIADTLSKI